MSDEKYTATLVRGETYVIANRAGGDDYLFSKGVPVVISAEQKAYIEGSESAVDEVPGEIDPETNEMDVQCKAKFAFAEYEGSLPIGASVSSASSARARKVIPATSPRRTKKVEAA